MAEITPPTYNSDFALESADCKAAMQRLENAKNDEIKDAVRGVVDAITRSFKSYFDDKRQTEKTVADADAESSSDSKNSDTNTRNIVRGVIKEENANTESIANEARKKLGSRLGAVSDGVTNFTKSINPILPSLKTFGIAFATTSLATMFLVNTMISAIKFIFSNPGMFLGAILGGTLIFQLFREPIMSFIHSISENVKKWISDVIVSVIKGVLTDAQKTVESIIDSFFGRLDKSVDNFFVKTSEATKELKSTINDSWSTIKTDIDGIVDTVFDEKIPNDIDYFFDVLTDRLPTLIETISVGFENYLSTSEQINGILGVANNMVETTNRVHPTIIEGIAVATRCADLVERLLNSQTAKLTNRVSGAVNTAVDWWKDKLGFGNAKQTTEELKEQSYTKGNIISSQTVAPMAFPYGKQSSQTTRSQSVGTVATPSTLTVAQQVQTKGLSFESLRERLKGEFSETKSDVKKSIKDGLKPVEDKVEKLNGLIDEAKDAVKTERDKVKGFKKELIEAVKTAVVSAMTSSKPSQQTVVVHTESNGVEGIRGTYAEIPEE